MRKNNIAVIMIIFLIVPFLIVGCGQGSGRNVTYQLKEGERFPPLVYPEFSFYADEPKPDIEDEMREQSRQIKKSGILTAQKNITYLVLSQGGQQGAFGAGILFGWKKNKPDFTIVTGVSAGAVMAPFAFLGGKYTKMLKKIYTEELDKRLFSPRYLPILFGAPSLSSVDRFEELIRKNTSEKMLDDIAREHKKGRRLLIGTTHLDSEKPVTWDIGKLALSDRKDRLDIFRKIIRASASIPGLFPPILFARNTKRGRIENMHVDGGVARGLFMPFEIKKNMPENGNARNTPDAKKHHEIYIILNDYDRAPYQVIENKATSVILRTINAIIASLSLEDIENIRENSTHLDASFHVSVIAECFKRFPNALFDRNYARILFSLGVGLAQNDTAFSDSVQNARMQKCVYAEK